MCVGYVKVRQAAGVFVSLTVCALHLPIVACFYKTDVSQVEDACDYLQHLSLDVTWDPNHLHGFLEITRQQRAVRAMTTSLIHWKYLYNFYILKFIK